MAAEKSIHERWSEDRLELPLSSQRVYNEENEVELF